MYLQGVLKEVDNLGGGMEEKIIQEVIKWLDKLNNELGWDGLFLNQTVSDLLWGYEDKLLKTLNDVTDLFKKPIDTIFAFGVSV